MLTAREITRATVSSEAMDCTIISILAHPVSGITSDRRGYYHDPSSDYVMAG